MLNYPAGESKIDIHFKRCSSKSNGIYLKDVSSTHQSTCGVCEHSHRGCSEEPKTDSPGVQQPMAKYCVCKQGIHSWKRGDSLLPQQQDDPTCTDLNVSCQTQKHTPERTPLLISPPKDKLTWAPQVRVEVMLGPWLLGGQEDRPWLSTALSRDLGGGFTETHVQKCTATLL